MSAQVMFMQCAYIFLFFAQNAYQHHDGNENEDYITLFSYFLRKLIDNEIELTVMKCVIC